MKIIADSGSTKTEWVILFPDGKTKTLNSIGLNPYFVTTDIVAKVVKETFSGIETGSVKEIYFYGAGCSSVERCNIIRTGLSRIFPHTQIETEHDMLGAARALFGNDTGIAIILGTGSNSCIYNGKQVTENIPALGYILGDEGSGAFFGLQLIKDFLNNEMPENISRTFFEKYHFAREDILDAVYKQPFPNRYLAQFTSFCSQNQKNDYIRKLVSGGFDLFFKRHIFPYPDYKNFPLGCIGSVGFYLQDILKTVAGKYDLHVKVIEKSPVDRLVNFHKKKSIH